MGGSKGRRRRVHARTDRSIHQQVRAHNNRQMAQIGRHYDDVELDYHGFASTKSVTRWYGWRWIEGQYSQQSQRQKWWKHREINETQGWLRSWEPIDSEEEALSNFHINPTGHFDHSMLDSDSYDD